MKKIKRLLKEQLEKYNSKPIKRVVLNTKLTCFHYKNGNIKVISHE